nr:hypothetical protein Iba_chr09cCG4950 [Ipomoea batatas]GMD33700.1 hypothetical protein Iba_chr09cCG5090 [Ipomoea batatas]GMD37142.1 hypothetical protein Iba_chr09eCG6570 [Ipomoea batatas]
MQTELACSGSSGDSHLDRLGLGRRRMLLHHHSEHSVLALGAGNVEVENVFLGGVEDVGRNAADSPALPAVRCPNFAAIRTLARTENREIRGTERLICRFLDRRSRKLKGDWRKATFIELKRVSVVKWKIGVAR